MTLQDQEFLRMFSVFTSATAKEPQAIKVTLPDGKVVDGESWRTTPYQIAQGIRY